MRRGNTASLHCPWERDSRLCLRFCSGPFPPSWESFLEKVELNTCLALAAEYFGVFVDGRVEKI